MNFFVGTTITIPCAGKGGKFYPILLHKGLYQVNIEKKKFQTETAIL